MVWRRRLLVVSVLLSGCVHAPDEPLTPAEQQRLLDLKRDSGESRSPADRCASSTKLVRAQARQRQFDTVEGFSTRGCGP
ncbi:hypothetical protein [Polyangium sp. 6x1]|uniref:hypothetical protein n=1 Tax=Polyangium sp. 6x1 TaxID=3042689 RepID=UPI0024827155|nr:hypothetical protein [Polyangium sp. 6x1]MDI1442690.1 hypothetical protein [Polyangium sp. 6x1]